MLLKRVMFRDADICTVCLNCQENPKTQNLPHFDTFGALTAMGQMLC